MQRTLVPFRKRTASLPTLAESVTMAAVHAPALLCAYVRPSTSRALREKVMLAVTFVNDCRFCRWVHTGMALRHDVDLETLHHVLDKETFGSVASEEAVAILYAKHFADTLRRPTREAEQALARAFRLPQRVELRAYIHGIYLANMCGNAFDAWLARFRGQPVPEGHPLAEGVAALLAAPFVGGPHLWGALDRSAPRTRP